MKKIKNKKQHIKNRENNLINIGLSSHKDVLDEMKESYFKATGRYPDEMFLGSKVKEQLKAEGLEIKRGER
jgi:hypothetical protein